MSSPLVVGIAGGTASGKTTVARKVRDALADCRVAFIDQDSYYRDLSDMTLAERREVNFDHPDAFDTELLVEHLRELKAGRPIQKPVYDFVTSNRQSATVRVDPGDMILIEGILVLHMKQVRDEMNVRIYVDTDDDLRILRRLERDIHERGYDFDSVVSQYLRHVRPMHKGFIEPSKHHADIIVPQGGNNDIAIGMIVGALRARLLQAPAPQR
ncbi:uridine kinase [Vitiosangium sp. GDMCC 1.1324]|uniref:uridine kinase n=1 Tax=Vitiosangium sp. (strain GDMCC 1.1324) TaxID=2138576 RepID=UPI000D392437|nr:uridine kinase [Vitiosangium sp. GDMCC 1.1324]PTL85341.1 uridine kinase [Vitiosangium sp. GDMCC 1.1324]